MLARDPRAPQAWHLLGVTALDRGDPDAALPALARAAALAPEDARTHYHLGNALMALGRHAEAEARFRAALARRPDFSQAQNNLGNTLRVLGREAEAIACFRAILAARPDDPPALYNLGRALTASAPREAEQVLRRAFVAGGGALDPERRADLHGALGAALVQQARDREALGQFAAQLRLRPGLPEARFNASLSLLRQGRWRAGWRLYESRWEVPGFRTGLETLRPPPPVLDLNAAEGKHVLIRGEQGRGDIIQFARYVPLVARRAAHVTLTAFPELIPLLGRMRDAAPSPGGLGPLASPERRGGPAGMGIAAPSRGASGGNCANLTILPLAADPPHDVEAALLSLPLAFNTLPDSVPVAPYLTADPALAAEWDARLGPRLGPRFGPRFGPWRRIALCWRGSVHSARGAIPLEALLPLVAHPGASFHSAQHEPTDAERALLRTHRIADHAPHLTDYAETAALLSQMDLVISVDTSVAHLAGALGIPVWILLRQHCDWRWMLGRADTPWYPAARLFRQGPDGRWEPVIAAVRDALASLAA